MTTSLKALCVGRHRFLSDHFGLYFGRMGLQTHCVVGLDEAVTAAGSLPLDVVLCDYDLLAALAGERWERDAAFARVPIFAVSLTRRPEEMHLLDVNGVGGFLYLPTLDPTAALRLLEMTRRAAEYSPTGDLIRPMTVPTPG